MSLTWRDAVTTIVAAGALVVAIAVIRNWNVPIISNPRWAAFILIAIGIALCIVGNVSGQPDFADPYVMIMAVLGGGIILLAALALIMGTAVYVGLAAGVLLLMWLVSTIRHIFS
jgi:hypothetical protein